LTFAGSKFCSHCGAALSRTEVAGATGLLCPRCKEDMKTVTVGDSTVRECPKCVGLWLDPETLRQICTLQEKQAAVLARPPGQEGPGNTLPIRYIPCPLCHQLMNRMNFGRASGIIVDVCKAHGTWFDQDELRHAVEFIRAGGMEKARTRELADIEDQRSRLAAENSAASMTISVTNYSSSTSPGSVVSDILRILFE